VAALVAYYGDLRHGRYRSAWRRLSADTRYYWGSYHAFVDGAAWRINHVSTVTNDPDQLRIWLTPTEDAPHAFGDAVLARAWVIEVTHGPRAGNGISVWVVAPEPEGAWPLWEVRP